jgi:hypothetical protein
MHDPAGFKPKIPASERPQTHALDRAAVFWTMPNARGMANTRDVRGVHCRLQFLMLHALGTYALKFLEFLIS